MERLIHLREKPDDMADVMAFAVWARGELGFLDAEAGITDDEAAGR